MCVCAYVCVSSFMSVTTGALGGRPDTAGRRDLQTMFMTVGLLLGLATKDRLYTQIHTDTLRLAESPAAETGA